MTRYPLKPLLLVALLALCAASSACRKDEALPVKSDPVKRPAEGASMTSPVPGPWRATIKTPGGALPFTLELSEAGGVFTAVIVNGKERVEVPEVTLADNQLSLALPLYDSRVVAAVKDGGRRLEGTWTRTRKAGPTTLPFTATAGEHERFPAPPELSPAAKGVEGRWSVKIAGKEDPAVAVFEKDDDGTVTGSLLTKTGDYRYLTGAQHGTELSLSTFDGSFAYLFRARLDDTGDVLQGELFAGDHWQAEWTARRDDSATLPDAFTLSRWTGERSLADLRFLDLDGKEVSLVDERLQGKARIIEIFGTWCPNCHDATTLLVELHKRYRDQGLAVVGLAFEYTGDFARDAAQVRKWGEHHGIEYPLLVAGTTGEGGPGEKLPLDGVTAYPTTLFVDRNDQVVAVHAGFSGPATGAAHEALVAEYEERVKTLLQ